MHDALRAVTIEAAYSWRMEDELGSITPGKLANFTVLAEDPYTVEPLRLKDIAILGNVYEGRWFPVSTSRRSVHSVEPRADGGVLVCLETTPDRLHTAPDFNADPSGDGRRT